MVKRGRVIGRSTLPADPREAPIKQSVERRREAPDTADMVPALVLGGLKAAPTLDGPLAPLDRTPAKLAWVFGGPRARVDESPRVTTQHEQQQGPTKIITFNKFKFNCPWGC